MELRLASIVLKGVGFTPGAVTASSLQSVFEEAAQPQIVAPPIAVVGFPSGFEVMIREDRLDIKKPAAIEADYPRMQRAARELLRLWPLVTPTQIGINFVLAETYDAVPGSRDRLLGRLMRPEAAEELLGAPLLGSIHTLVFNAYGAKVTLKITTDALLGERPAYSLDLNAHYEPVTDLEQTLATQGDWLARVTEWSERLTT